MTNPCKWRDTIYPSQSAAAKAAGLERQAIAWHLTKYGNLDRLGVVAVRKPAPEIKHAAAIRLLMPEGFGAEDIAQRLEVSPGAIRSAIAAMRASGEIAAMFPSKGARP